jgi:hypothetical protein
MDHIVRNPAQTRITVEMCPHRRVCTHSNSTTTATCDLISVLLEKRREDAAVVDRRVCEACCQSFPPTERNLNPVIASLVYTRATLLAEGLPAGPALERLRHVGAATHQALDVLYAEPVERLKAGDSAQPQLSTLLPPPRLRTGPRVGTWAIGVTTSPRIHPTLDECLDSIIQAGWARPQLFIDGPVRIADRHASLPTTYRTERVGAWPNYYLALAELMLRQPRADAFAVVQDDAVFYHHESLTRYLERVLWPSREPCLVSLYSCADDQARHNGWHPNHGLAVSGPVTLLFPAVIAKAFLTDFAVLERRWHPDEKVATTLGDLITTWANRQGIATWFPTPSLVRHIGDTSTLWPALRASGAQRAGRFADDPQP